MSRAEMIEEIRRNSGERAAARADALDSDEALWFRIQGARQQKALYEQAAARRAAWEREAQKTA